MFEALLDSTLLDFWILCMHSSYLWSSYLRFTWIVVIYLIQPPVPTESHNSCAFLLDTNLLSDVQLNFFNFPFSILIYRYFSYDFVAHFSPQLLLISAKTLYWFSTLPFSFFSSVTSDDRFLIFISHIPKLYYLYNNSSNFFKNPRHDISINIIVIISDIIELIYFSKVFLAIIPDWVCWSFIWSFYYVCCILRVNLFSFTQWERSEVFLVKFWKYLI